MTLPRLVLLPSIAIASCAAATSPPYTLYRNSSLDPAARIHWASFDAADNGGGSGDYNCQNCEMAVDLLRANLRALNGGEEPVRERRLSRISDLIVAYDITNSCYRGSGSLLRK